MENEKIENLLNVSLSVDESTRQRSDILSVGYSKEEKTWELIIRYINNLDEVYALSNEIEVFELLGNFAILKTPQSLVERIALLPSVIFVEMPKRLNFAIDRVKSDICVNFSLNETTNLTGKGVWIGIVDSGLDINHPAFRNRDGSSKVFRFLDQTDGNREYTKEELNQVLKPLESTGHGTAVAGIATSMAPESELLIVKLGYPDSDNFPRTTQLMAGVDYLIRKSLEFNKPIAINISFGMNYGSHSGQSLLENYLNTVSNLGQCAICVGSGNEGASPIHSMITVNQLGVSYENEFTVSMYQSNLNLQIWKYYTDDARISLRHPSGEEISLDTTGRYNLGSVTILVFLGSPKPYSQWQEIFLDFIPNEDYIDSGIWSISITPTKIVRGIYQLWLPTASSLNVGTGFVRPTPEHTLTIPSTAESVITVGAYDTFRETYATFSGRGPISFLNLGKPELVAPGVNIRTAAVGGGYETVSGTSFATPFVTGACALLMQWGIVNGNDRFLYGQKLKAYLLKGAKPLTGYTQYPNNTIGWGKLCVRDSLPKF
ncbi:hypothetical protein P261_01874 [Lachnospiraceae bacterium TWA4]|nr:hypothetical protein P261_01874 [Lachnospiraceae bacterium TWA4]